MFSFLKNLTHKKTDVPTKPNIQTAPLTEEQLNAETHPIIRIEPPQLVVGVGQSVGQQREHNEDTVFALNATLAGISKGMPFGIFMIADGMGGHQHGEVASQTAVRVVASHLVRKLYLPFFSPEQESQNEPMQEVLREAVVEAQQAVLKAVPGGGTTLTVAFVLGSQVTLAHVGDSRAYFLYPDGRIEPITRDHSLVNRLIELGQITEAEAAVHPQRNVLYRAIGQGEPLEPDINSFPLPHPGYLMLCSDGLWGVVPETEIFRIVAQAQDPVTACQDLVAAANMAGGPDNISVILIQYPS